MWTTIISLQSTSESRIYKHTIDCQKAFDTCLVVALLFGCTLRLSWISPTIKWFWCQEDTVLESIPLEEQWRRSPVWCRQVYKTSCGSGEYTRWCMWVRWGRRLPSYNTELLRSLGDEVGILIDQDYVCLLPIGSKGIDTPEDWVQTSFSHKSSRKVEDHKAH